MIHGHYGLCARKGNARSLQSFADISTNGTEAPAWVGLCAAEWTQLQKKKRKITWFFSGPANLNQTEAPPRQQFVVTARSHPPSTNCYSHHRRGLLLLLLPRKKNNNPLAFIISLSCALFQLSSSTAVQLKCKSSLP